MATKVNFAQAIKLGFQNYATFKGVASRSEFWYFILFYVLVGTVANMVDDILIKLARVELVVGLQDIVAIGLLLPLLALSARRFKDAGFSAWLLWLQALPSALFIGFLIALLASPAAVSFFEKAVSDPTYVPTEAELQAALASVDPTIFIGLAISLLLALGWALFQFIIQLLPTKTRAQGNKYAPEAASDYNGTTA